MPSDLQESLCRPGSPKDPIWPLLSFLLTLLHSDTLHSESSFFYKYDRVALCLKPALNPQWPQKKGRDPEGGQNSSSGSSLCLSTLSVTLPHTGITRPPHFQLPPVPSSAHVSPTWMAFLLSSFPLSGDLPLISEDPAQCSRPLL